MGPTFPNPFLICLFSRKSLSLSLLIYSLYSLVWILVPLADAHNEGSSLLSYLLLTTNNTIYLSSSFTRSHSTTLFLIISTSFSLQWPFDQTIISGISDCFFCSFHCFTCFCFWVLIFFTLLWMFSLLGCLKFQFLFVFLCLFPSNFFLFYFDVWLVFVSGFWLFYTLMNVFIDGLFKVSIFFVSHFISFLRVMFGFCVLWVDLFAVFKVRVFEWLLKVNLKMVCRFFWKSRICVLYYHAHVVCTLLLFTCLYFYIVLDVLNSVLVWFVCGFHEQPYNIFKLGDWSSCMRYLTMF